MKDYIRKNPELLMLLYVPVYLLWYFLAENFITAERYVSYMPLDDRIPFVPQFVVAYVLWYPFMLLPIAVLYRRDRGAYKRYGTYFIAAMSLSLTICCVFPSAQELRPADPGQGLFSALVGLVYAADTNTNVLPSMHVVGCVGGVLAFFDSPVLRRLRWPALLLAALICASTVFVKQHSFLDVIGGLALGGVVGLAVYLPHALRNRGNKAR